MRAKKNGVRNAVLGDAGKDRWLVRAADKGGLPRESGENTMTIG